MKCIIPGCEKEQHLGGCCKEHYEWIMDEIGKEEC